MFVNKPHSKASKGLQKLAKACKGKRKESIEGIQECSLANDTGFTTCGNQRKIRGEDVWVVERVEEEVC